MEGGKPVVIANAEGMRTTPSVVGFSKEGERVVGQMARRQTVLNPQNTFFAVKRFIGRKYGELNSDSKRVPYTIRKDEIGNIKVACPRLNKEFSPEEISLQNIIIDPGHGGREYGATSIYQEYEKYYNLEIAILLQKFLKIKYPKLSIFIIRNKDEIFSLEERSRISNKQLNDIFIIWLQNSCLFNGIKI
jgi:N-acetylmuramoyl-L-alanine amidase